MPCCHARIVDPEHGPPQDRDRCRELHEVGQCQLVRGHEGQHVLRYGSATIGWPDGEQHPTQWLPWAPTFPRDERWPFVRAKCQRVTLIRPAYAAGSEGSQSRQVLSVPATLGGRGHGPAPAP